MQQFIKFISKNSNRLLFLLLMIIALFLTINTHYFHKGLYLSSANAISGSYYDKVQEYQEYFHLKEQNDLLASENKRLKERLYKMQSLTDTTFHINSKIGFDHFKIFESKIIRNSFLKKKNYLTIRGGRNLGIKKDMGVIGTQGVVGIIENTSANYAIVQSILNTNTKISAKVKNSDYFGTIVWDSKDPQYVQLLDVPKLAKIYKGDSIVTGGVSTIFPENIPIGFIEKVFTSKASNFYTIKVKLFADMTNINHVYIIENENIEEINNLEEQLTDE